MKLGTDFGINLNEVEEQGKFAPLPAGKYLVQVTDNEVKQTKAKTGTYLKVTLEVISDEYKGRKLFQNFNLVNPNEEAVRIGRGQLKSFVKACHMDATSADFDTNDLQGAQAWATVKIKNDPTYGDGNEITGFEPIEVSSEQKKMVKDAKKIFGPGTKAVYQTSSKPRAQDSDVPF